MLNKIEVILGSLFLILLGIYAYGYFFGCDVSIPLVAMYLIVAMLPSLMYMLIFGDLGVSWQDKFSVMVFLQWVGTVIWFFAGLLDIYYTVFLGSRSIISEVTYVLGYIPVIMGLSLYTYTLYSRIGVELSQRQMLFLLFITLAVSLVSSIVFWSLLSGAEIQSFEDYAVNVIYVVFDGVLLFVIILGWLSFGGRMERVMKLFMGSALLLVIYDISYAYLNLQGLYFFGHPIDILAYSAYLVYTAAFNEVKISMK